MVMKLGRFGKQIRNTWRVLKCGVGEGWKRSFGRIVREMKYNKEPRRRHDNLETIERRKTNWTGHMLRRNCLLKCVIEGKIEIRREVTGRRGRDAAATG